MLTLHGPGGVGKTRLALAIAADLMESFPDGVFFVPLQDITDAGLLLSAISQSLELYTLPDETILPTLIGYMKDMGALLVLDNFEQLTAAAPILAELMAACPHLKLLVTSRAILNLRGEHEMEVEPLPLPQAGGKRKDGPDLEPIESSPAVQLFMQRARSVKPDFAIDSDNAQIIADICARLDGLPLALELAAARIKFLSPRALLARLQKRLQVLTGGAQDLPPRQQTLHNAINWSYDLLTNTEQRIFRLLSVFSGGCTLEAAEAVCAGMAESLPPELRDVHLEPDLLNPVTSLANKSLLKVVENDEDEEELRIAMLETLREYAYEQLQAKGEEAPALASLARYITKLAEEAGAELFGRDQPLWLDRLEREIANIRVVLGWCLSEPADVDTSERLGMGLVITGHLARFWHSRSHLHEGSEWLEAFLNHTTSIRTEERAQALRAAARIATYMTRIEQARVYYQEALDIARERNDLMGTTTALLGLGNNLRDFGDDEGALNAYRECLQIWSGINYKPGIAGALNNIGLVMMNARDPSAIGYLEQSVRIYRDLGDQTRLSLSLDSLGRAHLHRGDLGIAEEYALQALDMNLRLGDQWNIAYGLISLAEIACAHSDPRRATLLLATANAIYDDLTDRLDRFDQTTYVSCLETSRQVLGVAQFDTTWAEGLRLTPTEAISRKDTPSQAERAAAPGPASGIGTARPQAQEDPGLSAREVEVLALLAHGLSNAELAERLFLSLYTINAHLRTIYRKLNVSSRAAATRYAIEHGMA